MIVQRSQRSAEKRGLVIGISLLYEFKSKTLVKILYESSLVFRKFFDVNNLYRSEYESQSQGIKPQPLPKQRKIIVVCLQ